MTDALGPLPEPDDVAFRFQPPWTLFTAAQMEDERRRCYALGAAKARAESAASLGPLPVGLLTDGEAAAVRAWAEDYAAAAASKARADERERCAKLCADLAAPAGLSDAERSVYDTATMACESAIRAAA